MEHLLHSLLASGLPVHLQVLHELRSLGCLHMRVRSCLDLHSSSCKLHLS
jgi:hypothetical protein